MVPSKLGLIRKGLFKIAKWMLGVVMPEIFVLCAVSQYFRVLNDFLAMKARPGWTFKHSFFSDMGGLRLNGQVYSSGHELVEHQADLNKETLDRICREIDDKSKAGILGKLFTISKIVFFSVQIITKAAHSLYISPLEYFTCAQVFCAFLMYIYWIGKPYDVDEPIELMARDRIEVVPVERDRGPFSTFDILLIHKDNDTDRHYTQGGL